MEKTFEELEFRLQQFEARPDHNLLAELKEQIDYLMLEESIKLDERKQLRAFKTRLMAVDMDKPHNQDLLTKQEIFENQKKMLYDCEQIGLEVSGELERQNESLKGSNTKVFKIDGKLTSSSGLLMTIKRNIQKNKLMLRIAIFVILLVFLIILF